MFLLRWGFYILFTALVAFSAYHGQPFGFEFYVSALVIAFGLEIAKGPPTRTEYQTLTPLIKYRGENNEL